MSLSVAFIGDLHLDKLNKYWPDAIHKQLGDNKKILTYCVRTGIKHIVYLGDISETPNLSDESKEALFFQLEEFHEKYGLLFHIILGNHDYSRKGQHSLKLVSSFATKYLGSGVFIHENPQQQEIDGVPFNFCPFPFFEEYPESVNVGHFEVSGAKTDSGIKVEKTKHHPQHFWVMGHLHTRQKVRNIFYPGTPYQLNFGERLPKGFLVGNFSYKRGELQRKLEWVEVSPSFTFQSVEALSQKQLESLEFKVNSLYRLYVKDIVLSTAFLDNHPNVVQVIPLADKHTLENSEDLAPLSSSILAKEEEILTKYLQRSGYSEKVIQKALAIRFGS